MKMIRSRFGRVLPDCKRAFVFWLAVALFLFALWAPAASRRSRTHGEKSRAETSSDTAQALFDRAEEADKALSARSGKITRQDYNRVIGLYRRIFDRNSASNLCDDALLRMAQLARDGGRICSSRSLLEDAIRYADWLLTEYPYSPKRADAFFLKSEVQEKDLQDPAGARTTLLEFRKRIRKSPRLEQVEKKLRELEGAAATEKAAAGHEKAPAETAKQGEKRSGQEGEEKKTPASSESGRKSTGSSEVHASGVEGKEATEPVAPPASKRSKRAKKEAPAAETATADSSRKEEKLPAPAVTPEVHPQIPAKPAAEPSGGIGGKITETDLSAQPESGKKAAEAPHTVDNKPDPAPTATPAARPASGEPVEKNWPCQLQNIRYWSTSDYTRVVLDLNRETAYSQEVVEEPHRITLDLKQTGLSATVRGRTFNIGDSFLYGIRVSLSETGQARVTLDFKKAGSCTVFTLDAPFRIVVDIRDTQKAQVSEERKKVLARHIQERRGAIDTAELPEKRDEEKRGAASPESASSRPVTPPAKPVPAPSTTSTPAASPSGGSAAASTAPPTQAAKSGKGEPSPVPVPAEPKAGKAPEKTGASSPRPDGEKVEKAPADAPAAEEKPPAGKRSSRTVHPLTKKEGRKSEGKPAEKTGEESPSRPEAAPAAKPVSAQATSPGTPAKAPVAREGESAPVTEAGKPSAAAEEAKTAETRAPEKKVAAKVDAPAEEKAASVRKTRRGRKTAAAKDAGEPREGVTLPPPPTADGQRTLARILGMKVGRIVIDPGHGGKDVGSTGYNGIYEKDVTLAIARTLKKRVEEELGITAVLTRDDDVFLPLEQRTAIANLEHADLFISIHANASRNRQAGGIETFYLGLTRDRRAQVLAAYENATSEGSLGQLENAIKKIALNEKVNESKEFALRVHQYLLKAMGHKDSTFHDRGVKKAPFVVLIGADIPSILVEIGFISNQEEAEFISSPENQNQIAASICSGIERYLGSLGTLAKSQRGEAKKDKTERARAQ